MEPEQLRVIEVKRNYIAKKENILLLLTIITFRIECIHIPGYGLGFQECPISVLARYLHPMDGLCPLSPHLH